MKKFSNKLMEEIEDDVPNLTKIYAKDLIQDRKKIKARTKEEVQQLQENIKQLIKIQRYKQAYGNDPMDPLKLKDEQGKGEPAVQGEQHAFN